MLYFALKSFVSVYSLSGTANTLSYFFTNVEEELSNKVKDFSPSQIQKN